MFLGNGLLLVASTNKTKDNVDDKINQWTKRRPLRKATRDVLRSFGKVARYERTSDDTHFSNFSNTNQHCTMTNDIIRVKQI